MAEVARRPALSREPIDRDRRLLLCLSRCVLTPSESKQGKAKNREASRTRHGGAIHLYQLFVLDSIPSIEAFIDFHLRRSLVRKLCSLYVLDTDQNSCTEPREHCRHLVTTLVWMLFTKSIQSGAKLSTFAISGEIHPISCCVCQPLSYSASILPKLCTWILSTCSRIAAVQEQCRRLIKTLMICILIVVTK